MDHSVALTRQQKQWNKALTHHLQRYSNLRDWSQLASWLNKLKNQLIDYKGTVIEKSYLLKKLATSLSPALPVALHELTLQIYQILFAQIISIEQLQITCLGLFSFYSNANLKNKTKIVQLFSKYFINFGKDLKILASGLVITVLPSYIQMNDNLVKQVSNLLELMSKKQMLGQQTLIQAIWISIVRSSNCRIAGLKYLSSKIGKGDEQADNQQEDTFWQESQIKTVQKQSVQEIKEEQQNPKLNKQQSNQVKNNKELILRYCPHIQTVVINALLCCLLDSNILVVKNALDFLYKYLPLKNQIIEQQAKSKLTKSIVMLLSRRDMSLTRKINLWLFGKPDIQNRFSMLPKNIQFLTITLIDYLQEKQQTNIEPLKIIFNLFSEHQNLPSLILSDIAKFMISYCHRCQSNTQVAKQMNRIIDRVQGKVSLFANSLGNQLLDCIQEKQYRQAQKILQLISYFINKVLKPQEVKDIIVDVLKVIVQSYTKTNWQERQYMKNAITQTLQLIDRFREVLLNSKLQKLQKIGPSFKKRIKLDQNTDISLKSTISKQTLFIEHINLYQNLIKIISEDKQNQKLGVYQRQLVCINKMQVKLFQIFGIYSQKWVQILISVIYLNNPQYYLESIEVIGQALENDNQFKKKILQLTDDQNKQNFVSISIRKIWSILSLGHLQSRIIPLLLRLTKFFPHYFQTILQQQFGISNEISITKFTLFWNLAPKHTNIISHEQLQQICKSGLFRMLGYLDNGNPLVKYNSNIWINQCFPNFQRVLNPLLQILLKPKEFWYQTLQGQYVYVIEPQKDKIIHVLTHIKSIVKHTASKFFKFSLKCLTPNLLPYYEVFKEQETSKNQSTAGSNQSTQISNITRIQDKGQIFVFEGEDIYINCLFQIIVKLIGSKYTQKQNPGIDLVACQTLQVLIRNVPNSHLCFHIIQRNLRNILKCLHFATVNREHLLQIQILNLLKIIFFESNLRKHYNEQAFKFLREIISSSLFLNTILQGLDAQFPYIKERFVQFINLSIVLILQYHSNSSQIISKIFNTYCNKISVSNQKKMEINNKKDLTISKINAQILILFSGIKQLLSYFLNMNIKQFQKQKSQTDADSGVFSLYSYKSYVSLKVEKKVLQNGKAKRVAQEISKQIAGELTQLFITMTNCWTVSQLMQYYKISMQGLALFQFDQFHAYNKQLYSTMGRFQVEQSVQNFIINLVRVLINKYPNEVMNAMIQAWTSAHSVDMKIKIIQILNLSSIPIQNFYHIMCECVNSQRIQKKKKANTFTFDSTMNIQKSVLHFCQAFTHYNFQNFAVFQAPHLINVWLSFLKFIKLFEQARNIQTLFGLLELIDLFMKKNNPIQIMREQRIKKQFNHILNIINDLFMVCSGKGKVHCDEKKIYDFQAFIPLPSSIFDCYLVQTSKKQDAKLHYLCFDKINSEKCQEYCRVYAFLISKRIGYNLLVCFFRDDVSLVKKVKQFVLSILPIIEDKSLGRSQILIQNASELLLSILEKKHMFLKELKGDILQVFNKDDFFICSSKTLHCWVKIIDMIIDNNKDHDIFTQYLDKVSLVSSIFSSYSLQTKKKIKSFERICFILYAGKKDKYNQKAHLLIDKIIDVIKNTDASQPVLILIFFCLRILILRSSPQKLTKLFANLWQMIMFLLINVFKQPVKQQSRLNLVWAALKLIEMISIMQMSQFHQHQWMFFFDFIGIKFNQGFPQGRQSLKIHQSPSKKMNNLTLPTSLDSEKKIQKRTSEQNEGQKFELGKKPMICRFLPAQCQIKKCQVNQIQQSRHLIIKEDKIDDIELLNTKALLLSSYLVNNNQQKMKFEMKQIQELIQNDFLNLDEFIFKFVK